jgi:hypothetical protein
MEGIKKYKYWKWSIDDISDDIQNKSTRKYTKDSYTDDNKEGTEQTCPPLENETNVNIKRINNFVPFETIIVEPNNKRCENSERLSTREMVIQTNINPFLNNNYLDDIKVQDTILRPKDSNYKDDAVKYNN